MWNLKEVSATNSNIKRILIAVFFSCLFEQMRKVKWSQKVEWKVICGVNLLWMHPTRNLQSGKLSLLPPLCFLFFVSDSGQLSSPHPYFMQRKKKCALHENPSWKSFFSPCNLNNLGNTQRKSAPKNHPHP